MQQQQITSLLGKRPTNTTRAAIKAAVSSNASVDKSEMEEVEQTPFFDPNKPQVEGQTSLMSFMKGKGMQQVAPKTYLLKPKLLPKSLLKQGVSTTRYLQDQSQSIFNIIMPWRVELEAEELKRQKKDKQSAKER